MLQACATPLRILPGAGAQVTRALHTSPACMRRMGKRPRASPEWKRLMLAKGPWWKEPIVEMKAPLSKTFHPENKFESVEKSGQDKILQESLADDPDFTMKDPYEREPMKCVLCPRRYKEPIFKPNHSFKNPKLLSQFVSPHTGLLYGPHITGLCSTMQEAVQQEVNLARNVGLMSTHVKDPNYLQDPSLFNASRPIKPNPY